MSAGSICSIVCFNSDITLLIFCLDDVCIEESGLWEIPTHVLESNSTVKLNNTCAYLDGLLLCAHMFKIATFSL